MARILLVDDHEIWRRGLRTLLEVHPGWTVCGEAADGRMAVELAAQLQPDVVLMDLTMPHLNGFEAAHQMLRNPGSPRVLIVSVHETEQVVQEVLAAGVSGYLLKSETGARLCAAVEAVLRGEKFFVAPLAARLHAEDCEAGHGWKRRAPPAVLTRREREILQLLAEGRTNKEVGTTLGISVKTAETHRARLMRKLSFDSVADLVRYAIRNGFIVP